LVFDLYKRDSFTNMTGWLKEVEKNAKHDVSIIIIGNKSDKVGLEQPEVSETDIQKLTEETGIKVYLASAKSGDNVEKSFLTITQELIDKASESSKKSLFSDKRP
jgi:GTPase SAR1 family protein